MLKNIYRKTAITKMLWVKVNIYVANKEYFIKLQIIIKTNMKWSPYILMKEIPNILRQTTPNKTK